jgi:hypothetical protein
VSRIVRGTLTTFLLAVLRDAGHIVKIYMPEVDDNDVQDIIIISINTRSEIFKLIYTGSCQVENVHSFHLVPHHGA